MKVLRQFTVIAFVVWLVLNSLGEVHASHIPSSVIVFIDGKPRNIAFTSHMTLTTAIRTAGIYGECSRKPVYLERHKAARRVDMRAIIDGRAPDIALESADVIIIGQSPKARP